MNKYELHYTVVVEAENKNIAEMISADLEGDIRSISKRIVLVDVDPYVEQLK